MTVVQGHCDPRVRARARGVRAALRRGRGAGRRRSPSSSTASPSWTCGAASPTGAPGRPWEQRHARARLLVHQGGHRDRRCCSPSAALSTSTAPVADCWPEFAAGGKEHDHRRAPAHPPGRAAGARASRCRSRSSRTRRRWPPPGGAGRRLGAGHRARLPRADLRLAGRRGRPPGTRASTVGEFVGDEIAGPCGLDLWVGAPDDVIERARARLSPRGERTARRQRGDAGRATCQLPGKARRPAARDGQGLPATRTA